MSKLTLVAGAATNRGPRPVNEDAYLSTARPEMGTFGALYAVADGVGGQSEGAQAAQLAIKVLNDSFYQGRQSGQDIPTALSVAVQEVNGAIYRTAQARGGDTMGSTLVAAVVHQQHLFLAHVGDARAYLLGKQLRQLTKDHSWVQEQVDAGTLTPAEAARHDLRNIVTRVLGNKPDVVPELSGPIALHEGDTILLCSDGLYDVVDARGLQRYLSGADPEMAALNLVQAAVTAGTGDNVTAVVMRWTDPNNAGGPRSVPFYRNRRYFTIFLALLAVGAFILFLATRRGEDVVKVTVGTPTPLPTYPPPMRSLIEATEVTIAQESSSCGYGPGSMTCPPEPAATSIEARKVAESALAGCVVSQGNPVLLWLDSNLNDDGELCDYTSETLVVGIQVEILTDPDIPRRMLGPIIDLDCKPMDFIKVRSAESPDLEGWVLTESIKVLGEGEQCP